MYLVQATVAMAGWTLSELQQQEFVLAQEDTLSTHRKDLIPEPHTRTSKRMANDRQRGTFHILDPTKDLHTITSYEYPRKTFIQAPVQSIVKIAMQGPVEDDFNRISPRSSHKNLAQVMQGHLAWRISPRSVQELLTSNCDQDRHARTPKRNPQEQFFYFALDTLNLQ